tara:strand:+ start:127 stop:642 length:516 start_codon:yes stop_codon:yes gene_type:complete
MLTNYNYLKLTLFIIIVFSFFSIPSISKLKANDAFYAKGHIIHDLKLNIYWLRCSAGQVWNGEEQQCVGKPIKLTMDQIDQAIELANKQLGGKWRLPTRNELENLVCMTCGKTKINKRYFPNTPYEPFWTGEKNDWSKNKGFYWSVNFFTGHTFGRFPGHIPNFVRLVRDR